MFAEVRLEVQLALGIVFALSAAGKMRDPTGFARGVADYNVLPASMSYLVALIVIALESYLAIAHLTGRLLTVAAILGFGMLSSFAVAVAVNLARGRALPCFCFGSRGEKTISGRTLARLLLLMSVELFIVVNPSPATGIRMIYPVRITDLPDLGLAFLGATFLLLVGCWLLNLPDLIELLQSSKRRPAAVGTGEPSTGRASKYLTRALGDERAVHSGRAREGV
ncbi:MAG: hypothetical protein L0387_40050 [Acidobacteria bacterium]|nr:hypothetical protein [Acidobacteriota bacterium]